MFGSAARRSDPGPVLPDPAEDVEPTTGRRILRWLITRLRLPRYISPTLEGWIFFVLAFAVIGAALNTGNNLLYMMFALMLGMVAVSSVMSESALKQVRVQRVLPRTVFAGQPASGRLVVANRRRFMPNVALQLHDLPSKRCDVEVGPVALSHLPPHEQTALPIRYRFRRRGLHRLAGFRVSTVYPFSLFRKWYDVVADQEVLVYPELGPWRIAAASLVPGAGEEGIRGVGLDGDFHGLREFKDGDDARQIHWKVSARRGALVAVERTRTSRRACVIHLLPGGDPRHDAGYIERFEIGVSVAASVACQLIEEGHEVGLTTPAGEVAPGRGADTSRAILTHLALIRVPTEPLAGELAAMKSQLGGGDVIVA